MAWICCLRRSGCILKGELFAQVTGYVDLEGAPGAGVELGYESQLLYDDPKAGEPTPMQQVTRDDLQMQLTIDSRLQRIAQEGLAARRSLSSMLSEAR